MYIIDKNGEIVEICHECRGSGTFEYRILKPEQEGLYHFESQSRDVVVNDVLCLTPCQLCHGTGKLDWVKKCTGTSNHDYIRRIHDIPNR